MKYTAADSFAGAGGLSLGLVRAGFDLLLSFDNDPVCVETLKLNERYFQHPAELHDINDVLGGVLLRSLGLKPGELFLLAGGPPCQGFPVQRIGSDDDLRNSLVLKFISLVLELKPRFFLMENVPGIRGKRGASLLSEALQLAANGGYFIHESVLDAQDFGVPQRRRRVFVVGERADNALARFSFPQPTTTPETRHTVRQAIGWLPPTPPDGAVHPGISLHRADRLSELNRQRLEALAPGQGREHLPDHLLADCHKRSSDAIGHRNVYGRMPWDDVAPTITARFDSFTRGQFGHPEQVRSISLREGALLQTFPLDFEFYGNKVEVARQVGNAVPPVLAEILGRQIIDCST